MRRGASQGLGPPALSQTTAAHAPPPPHRPLSLTLAPGWQAGPALPAQRHLDFFLHRLWVDQVLQPQGVEAGGGEGQEARGWVGGCSTPLGSACRARRRRALADHTPLHHLHPSPSHQPPCERGAELPLAPPRPTLLHSPCNTCPSRPPRQHPSQHPPPPNPTSHLVCMELPLDLLHHTVPLYGGVALRRLQNGPVQLQHLPRPWRRHAGCRPPLPPASAARLCRPAGC